MSQSKSISDVVRQLSRFTKRHKHGSPRSSHRYMHLLRLINELKSSKASELAGHMGIRPASLSEMITNLEADGFIKKIKDDHDKRVTKIQITESGLDRLKALQEEKDNTFDDILTEDEEAEFIRLSQKMIEHLETQFNDRPCNQGCRRGHHKKRNTQSMV